ncbi:hypothetical protein EYF80_024228 [Liparis tanakae]|uniref:Uncharacterized protein n=1 Tax=Liparis tanakae TaxID=230148 RepID=A0A4Z2HJ18_9TELE|nr:hypothetical protein EYF80_024228 [Liparis tanakae]
MIRGDMRQDLDSPGPSHLIPGQESCSVGRSSFNIHPDTTASTQMGGVSRANGTRSTSFLRSGSLASTGAYDALNTKGSAVGSMKKIYLWSFSTVVHGASEPKSPTGSREETFSGEERTSPSMTTADWYAWSWRELRLGA